MKIISEGQEINFPSVNVNDGIYDDQERVIGTFFGKPPDTDIRAVLGFT